MPLFLKRRKPLVPLTTKTPAWLSRDPSETTETTETTGTTGTTAGLSRGPP